MKDDKGWKFQYTNGSYATGTVKTAVDGTVTEYVTLVKTGDKWYAFDKDAYMMIGWVYDASTDNWYWCDKTNGDMQTGWLLCPDDGYTYYFDLTNGAMFRGWHTIDAKRYFFHPDHCGTYFFDAATEKWIYNNPNKVRPLGSLYMNVVTPDGTYVNAQGAAES